MACVSLSENLNNSHQDTEEPMELCQSGVTSNGICSKYEHKKQPPPQFSDPSSIIPPESLHELVTRLHEIFDHDDISVEYVQALMASYKSNRRQWKRFAKFDPHRYTRNLVDDGNGKFNLMILCWNEGQGSSIHSHANSHCFLKVLSGGVKEELFEWPSGKPSEAVNVGSESDGPVMKKWAENSFGQDQCTYISDNIGLHRVENTSHSDKAVTLHLYSPPFDECQCFDERTGRAVTAKVTFWSKYGRRTPFGRCPDIAETPCQADNN